MRYASDQRIMTTRATLAFTLLALYACGGAEDSKPPTSSVGGETDGGKLPPSKADAAVVEETGYDNQVASDGKYLCGYDDEDVLELPGNMDHPQASIARSPGGFGLLFYDNDGTLRIQAAIRDGYRDEPVPVGTALAGLQAARLAASSDQYLLAARAAEDGAMVLRTRSLTSGSGADLIHTAALSEGEGEGELWDVVGNSAGYLLAYVDDALHLRRLTGTGELQGQEVEVAGVASRSPADLHVVELEQDSVLVAWTEPQADGTYRVMGQHFNAALVKSGGVEQLSKNPLTEGRFDFSARAQSAGLIYENMDGDVREAIKYRRVEPDGAVPGPVLNVVSAPRKAAGGHIVDFGQGYAIAYRVLPSLGVLAPEIRVAFINQFGEVVHEARLADTSEAGGPVNLSSTRDGYLLVSWTSSNGFEAKRTAIKMNCPGALLLCGGELE